VFHIYSFIDHLRFIIVGSSSATYGTVVAGFNPSSGSGFSELYYPAAIALTLDGSLYIADTSNYRVMKYLSGQPLGSVVAGGRGSGTSLTQIGISYGIALDSQSNIYVCEFSSHRVTKWVNTTAGIIVSISPLHLRKCFICEYHLLT
jgi:hypothetical protein